MFAATKSLEPSLWKETQIIIIEDSGSIDISLPQNHTYLIDFTIQTTDGGDSAYMRGNVKVLLQNNNTMQNSTLNSVDFYETGHTSHSEYGQTLSPARWWYREEISKIEMTAIVFIEVEITDLSDNIVPIALKIYQDPVILDKNIQLLGILFLLIPPFSLVLITILVSVRRFFQKIVR
jgi:hypothetical protein